jgi:hypothetical protein
MHDATLREGEKIVCINTENVPEVPDRRIEALEQEETERLLPCFLRRTSKFIQDEKTPGERVLEPAAS